MNRYRRYDTTEFDAPDLRGRDHQCIDWAPIEYGCCTCFCHEDEDCGCECCRYNS